MASNLKAMAEIAQTADHALRILTELGEGDPLTPSELATRLDLNRTVVHRLLMTLSARGFVLRQGSLYRPGAVLLQLAQVIEPDLRVIAAPIMSKLSSATEESAVLHVPDGLDAVVLHQCVSDRHVLQVSHRLGSRHSLAAGASGRAILAFSPHGLTRRVVGASADPATLRRSLDAIRKLGYSLSHDELQSGVHGVAVPILGADGVAGASLAVLMPTNRAVGIERHIDALLAAAAQIAAELSLVRSSGDRNVLTVSDGPAAESVPGTR